MRILIAEDNEPCRLLLCVALHGHEIFVAEDGAEAIAQAECKQPDVILMDVTMPEVDGFTALKELKSNEATTDIPVIMMSAACVRQQDIERALELGAVDYLRKPFPFPVTGLGKVLEGYVTKKKARAVARTYLQLQSNHN
jgi:CheY-like chemotaxis protein